jgi:hypothetical protein
MDIQLFSHVFKILPIIYLYLCGNLIQNYNLSPFQFFDDQINFYNAW